VGIQDGCDQVGFDSRNPTNTISTPRPEGLRHLSFSGDSGYLGPVVAVLSWVFLDMWDVKCRSQVAGKAASEVLLHSLE
jgi:hypothetical protein